MKTTLPSPTERKADVAWVKTPYPNLIRYKPSGTYFGRVRVNGKLIRRSLETHVLTVAKLKLSDFLQNHRRLAVKKGQSVNGEVIIEMFKKEIEDDHNNKPRSKLYDTVQNRGCAQPEDKQPRAPLLQFPRRNRSSSSFRRCGHHLDLHHSGVTIYPAFPNRHRFHALHPRRVLLSSRHAKAVAHHHRKLL